jgi:hypothetical protein
MYCVVPLKSTKIPQPVLPLVGEFIIVPLLLFSKSNTLEVPEYEIGSEKFQYNILSVVKFVLVGVLVVVGVCVGVDVNVVVVVGVCVGVSVLVGV